ncbi:hypothetical protein GUJ93_ZPchr0012g20962 [Zizania palustris]|uniref:Nodulin-related protein 1 n=1 Tax=Zizania palustris TaxID=103762 RepID=A0A8J5WMY8_ZIZPA|nr:hypothetical protein GUJ93_ZPchr0012g20962 [Zizania palustris]
MAEGNNSGDLMSSGKVVAEATVEVFQKKSVEGVDQKKVAGAAADLLQSASTYGKLDDKPVGQYIDKAEGYLKQFSSSGAAPPAATGDAAPKTDAEEVPNKEPAPAPPAPAAEEGKPSSEGFGLDDIVKVAESQLEKKGSDEESGGASAGGLLKMARGFLK